MMRLASVGWGSSAMSVLACVGGPVGLALARSFQRREASLLLLQALALLHDDRHQHRLVRRGPTRVGLSLPVPTRVVQQFIQERLVLLAERPAELFPPRPLRVNQHRRCRECTSHHHSRIAKRGVLMLCSWSATPPSTARTVTIRVAACASPSTRRTRWRKAAGGSGAVRTSRWPCCRTRCSPAASVRRTRRASASGTSASHASASGSDTTVTASGYWRKERSIPSVASAPSW